MVQGENVLMGGMEGGWGRGWVEVIEGVGGIAG